MRDELIDDLIRSFGELSRFFFRRKLEVSRGEAFVLQKLYESQLLSPAEIAGCLGVSAARVANILNSLERKGFVVRHFDETDRRRICVEITAQGRQAAQADRLRVRDSIHHLLEHLGEEDSQELVRILHKIVDTMKTEDSKSKPGTLGAVENLRKMQRGDPPDFLT